MLKKPPSSASKVQTLFRGAHSSKLGGIFMAGFNREDPGIKAMKTLDAYAVVYILNGSGRYLDTQGLDLPVTAGDMILVFPGLGHRYGPLPGGEWTQTYLVFDGPVFRLWQECGLLDPAHPILRAEPVDYWFKRLEAILSRPRQPGYAPPLVEICSLQKLLAELVMGGGQGAKEADMNMMARARALLESDLNRDLDLESLATQLGMSYESFRKRFTLLVGMPPARYRSERIIDRACELMQKGVSSNKQIAQELGYSDEHHFSRRFKEVTGYPPSVFRKRISYLA